MHLFSFTTTEFAMLGRKQLETKITDLNLPTSSLWDPAAANANLRFPSSAVNLYNTLTTKNQNDQGIKTQV